MVTSRRASAAWRSGNGAEVTTYADRLLEPDELKRVTGGLVQSAAQARALRALGVRFRLAPSGEPLVLLSALSPDDGQAPRVRPRMDAVRS